VMIVVSDITTLQNRGKYQGGCSFTHERRKLLTGRVRLAGCRYRIGQWSRSLSGRRCC
jgi:hypothetical protein